MKERVRNKSKNYKHFRKKMPQDCITSIHLITKLFKFILFRCKLL